MDASHENDTDTAGSKVHTERAIVSPAIAYRGERREILPVVLLHAACPLKGLGGGVPRFLVGDKVNEIL